MHSALLRPATLLGGSLVGAFALAAWLGAFPGEDETAAARAPVRHAAPAPRSDAPVAAPRALAHSPEQARAEAQSVLLAESCPGEPLAAPRGEADGRFALDAALSTGARVEPSAYITVAREAAQQGRMRDAEVAWLAACHMAERGSGGQSVPLADLKTQMAQQYAAMAAGEPAGPARDRLLKRASTLLSESAITYAAALGRDASKTRLAEQRLASLHDPATLQRARAELQGDPGTRSLGAAREPAQEMPAPESRTAPATARLVASDPELAQLESDMERLRAQAASVTRDPSGLRRRDGQALAQRDSACHDKACLLRWYAQRRRQLLAEF